MNLLLILYTEAAVSISLYIIILHTITLCLLRFVLCNFVHLEPILFGIDHIISIIRLHLFSFYRLSVVIFFLSLVVQ